MHIAFFTNSYHPMVSGVVRSVSTFRKALAEQGHNVFVFAQSADDYTDTEPFIFRYPSITVPWPEDIPALIPISSFIDQVLPSLKPEVIHTHHPILVGQAAASKAYELNIPLVFTYHTQYTVFRQYIPLLQEGALDFIKDAVENILGDFMQKCHHVIVPTNSMRDKIIQKYGLSDRVTVITTGIDLRQYQQADGQSVRKKHGWEDSHILISAGRLAREKNWGTLLDAGAKAINAHQDLRIVLVGDGPDREKLQKRARKLGIENQVEFVGKVAPDVVPSYLKAADIFGFPSTTETQGLVTVEALAAGLPIAAVDATGTHDIVTHGQEGFLTENNSDALANAIIKLLDDRQLRQRFKTCALEKAAEYSIIPQSQLLLDVYNQAIEDKKANRCVVVKKHKKLFRFKRDKNKDD